MFMFRPVNAILPARLTLSRTVSLRSTSLLRGYSTKEPNDTLECGDEKPKTVQNERLLRILSKSRTLTKLSRSKRFSHYFDKLSQAGAISTVTSFLVLHELTAIVPLFGMWWVLYNLDPSVILPSFNRYKLRLSFSPGALPKFSFLLEAFFSAILLADSLSKDGVIDKIRPS